MSVEELSSRIRLSIEVILMNLLDDEKCMVYAEIDSIFIIRDVSIWKMKYCKYMILNGQIIYTLDPADESMTDLWDRYVEFKNSTNIAVIRGYSRVSYAYLDDLEKELIYRDYEAGQLLRHQANVMKIWFWNRDSVKYDIKVETYLNYINVYIYEGEQCLYAKTMAFQKQIHLLTKKYLTKTFSQKLMGYKRKA